MPRHCQFSRSRILGDSSSITSSPILEFLLPHISGRHQSHIRARRLSSLPVSAISAEALFFDALEKASSCNRRKDVLRLRAQSYISVNHKRHASRHAVRHSNEAVNHQRFDSQGRLIIETTRPRAPEFAYHRSNQTQSSINLEQHFAANSTLPSDFFSEVQSIRSFFSAATVSNQSIALDDGKEEVKPASFEDQMRLLQSIRELEDKLHKAKKDLSRSLKGANSLGPSEPPTVLTKQEYKNLVDLYFYSYNDRFSPESTDASPTPTFFEDASFALSADFTQGDESDLPEEDDDELYVSPLREIDERMRNDKLREIAVFQVFVDLLLDDKSSNRALHEAYKQLPHPGVAYLPKSVIRLFLQRMSTPWVKTLASRLRYLSLIDDMQEAKLPITVAEWSSAIYLAGKSFSRIETGEVGQAIEMWTKMENVAGVRSSNVTFNILFDVAVRAGKFALGETILQEMYNRNLRLNRLGRVSLMYYHGLRGDGDGVRKAYHDFVEAGEIVDTLVLNCVIASLINAQEPTAAEQVYERMKLMQKSLQVGKIEDGQETLFKQYPDPGRNRTGYQMAPNELGRMLMHAPNLQKVLPNHHDELQASMPLTPNFTTFRILLAYHATCSGDLTRTTTLLQEMLQNFDIPLFAVVFQLLFKAFAIHGPKGGPHSEWSATRLDAIWQACRAAVIDSSKVASGKGFSPILHLPSIGEVDRGMARVAADSTEKGKTRTLSMWEELVIDLAAFPRERLKRVKRYHSTQFDENPVADQFTSPFFQEAHYDAPQPELDDEEGEYSLPNPIRSSMSNPNYEKINRFNDEDDGTLVGEVGETLFEDDEEDRPPTSPQADSRNSSFSKFESNKNEDTRSDTTYHLHASKPMVCWLLRAYSRITRNRTRVGEIWSEVRKIWRPKTDQEAQVVIKVLLRCLRDCDRESGRG